LRTVKVLASVGLGRIGDPANDEHPILDEYRIQVIEEPWRGSPKKCIGFSARRVKGGGHVEDGSQPHRFDAERVEGIFGTSEHICGHMRPNV
jgi:hypothetical protein